MGCDIHSYCEVKKNGRWKQVHAFFEADDYEIKYFEADDYEIKYYDVYHTDHPFVDRSYYLFSFLADVRRTSDVPLICERRGFPSDASDSLKKIYNNKLNQSGCHSESYLSLKELLEFDYEQKFEHNNQIITARAHLPERYFSTINQMRKLAEPENVRVVFWFDN